jgi:imidazolonepropionase-like amidohydrolase
VLAPDQQLARRPNIADTVDDVSRAARRDIKYGADWIKLMATGGVMDPISDYRVEELSEEQMAKAVEVAHRGEKSDGPRRGRGGDQGGGARGRGLG